MRKLFTTLSVSVVAFGTLIGSVEAKTVFYEINGQRYSYDTSNRKQAAAARKQIEAAKVAEAAQAKAAAERASNPLVALFGSQAQREAAEALAQLEKILSDQQQQAAAASKDQHTSPATKDEGAARPARDDTSKPVETTEDQQTAAVATVTSPSPVPDLRARAAPDRTDNARKAAIRSVFLDAETGIKTIIRTDGSIQEELFDPSILSKLDPEHRSAGAVRNVVNTDPLPKPSPEDATGSTGFRGATLEPGSRSERRGQSLTN
jgi:hypothetical protein